MKFVSTLILSLFILSIMEAQTKDYYPPTAIPDRIILNLTENPATSMAITWRTAVYVKRGFVQLALVDPSPNFADSVRTFDAKRTAYLSDQSGANYYSAIMDELNPGAQYAYRVGDSVLWSEWNHFSTASEGHEELSFIYFGDAQNDLKSMWSRAIRGAFMQMPKADFLLHAGDLVNRRNSDHEWGEWYYAGGWIYGVMPSIATPGNHEYGWNEQRIYTLSDHWRPTFTLPQNGPEGFEETVYYIDYQGTRIISLDSPGFRSKADSTAQINWLKNVLENNDQRWTIVTTHYPVYSTKFGRDNVRLRSALKPLFEKYHVDLVLQGHDHTYGRGTNLPLGKGKRNSIQGPVYVVSVSGPKMYDLGLAEWMQRGASNTQLYQIIRINDDVLSFEAYTVDNQLYDAFELKKNKQGKSVYIDLAPKEVPERLELPPYWKSRYTDQQFKDYQSRFEAYKARKKSKE